MNHRSQRSNERAVAERVPDAGGDLVDGRVAAALGVGALRREGDDRRDDEVDRDDVDDTFGDTGELAEHAAGVGDDHRLGHPEASDPARAGLGERGLDDGGPNDGDRQGAAARGQRDLAQGLREGVGVGPAEGLCPGPAEPHQPVVDPLLP